MAGEQSRINGRKGGRPRLHGKKKYEHLMGRVELLRSAAYGTNDLRMRNIWLRKAEELREQALNLTLEEAGVEV